MMEKRSMKLVSKTALGIALALGSVSLAASPAMAEKKPKEDKNAPKAEPLKLSKEFREAATPVDAAYKAQNWAAAKAAIDAAEPLAKASDEQYFIAQYRVDVGGKLKDTEMQSKGIDGMLASGRVPAADVGKYQFFAGKFAVEKKDYQKAQAAFAAAAAAGYVNSELYLSQTQAFATAGQPQQAIATLQKAIDFEKAAGRAAPEDWYKFGLSQAYKGKLNAEVNRWATMHVQAFPTAENWRTALVLFRDTNNPPDKPLLDLYRLMLAADSLAGEKDHYEYAFLANRAGLPGEAKVVIDHFKAKGGGTSAPITELDKEVAPKIASDKASLAREANNAATAANGVPAAGVANAYLGYGDYPKAVALYQTALGKGGVDADEVNTRIGIALARQGQKDAAKAAFAKVQSPARAGIAQYWSAWLDRPAG
jgi:tetratricopeptide (TPR) repeat protein